jgi:hypothetical protein
MEVVDVGSRCLLHKYGETFQSSGREELMEERARRRMKAHQLARQCRLEMPLRNHHFLRSSPYLEIWQKGDAFVRRRRRRAITTAVGGAESSRILIVFRVIN